MTFELTPDAGAFTPLQIKPTYILANSANSSFRWSRTFGVAHQAAISKMQTAFVVHIAKVKYLERYTYPEAEEITVTATRRAMRDGAQVELRASFEAHPGRPVVDCSLCMVPLTLVEGSPELAALPAPLPASYLSAFDPSEILHEPFPSPFPHVLREVVESGELLGSYEHPFFVHREQCEFVDQWYFVMATTFAAASRERMVFELGARIPALRRGLSLPVREMDLLFSRPFYLFDQGKARTRAFRAPEGVVFVHELIKDDPQDPHALVVERF